MLKPYSVTETVSVWGHKVIIYRTADGVVSVELQFSPIGTYSFPKIKTIHGRGNDQALNMTQLQCEILQEMLEDINKNYNYIE